MSEWLSLNEVVVTTVVGVFCLLLGIGISGWRNGVRRKRLTHAHEAKLQPLEQTLVETRRQVQSTEQRLAAADERLAERGREIAAKDEQLRVANEALNQAVDAQTELALRTEELQRVSTTLQSVEAQRRHLQTEIQQLESALQTKEATLEQTVQEATALRIQIKELTDELANQRDQLSTVQAAHNHEVARRQRISSEIASLYHHLQDDISSSETLLDTELSHNNGQLQPDGVSWQVPVTEAQPLVPVPTFARDGIVNSADGDRGTMPGISQRAQPTNKLEQFLVARGITIKHIPSEADSDPILNSLAGYLGTHYETIKPLYLQIKRNMQLGDDFTISLKDEPSDAISRICQFGKKLHEMAFLEQYHYQRSPHYLLRAKTTRLPTAQNFFSGQWLERYIVQQVQAAINAIRAQTDQSVDFNYISNPQIILPGGQEGELDLLFRVNDTMYWIETKSGDYQQHISKYSSIARTLNLDPQHAMMVLTDIPASRSTELTTLFRMGVCSLGEFSDGLMATLRKDLL